MRSRFDLAVVKKYQKEFDWPPTTTQAIIVFVLEELSDDTSRSSLDESLLLLKKLAGMINKRDQLIPYLARDKDGWPDGHRELKKEVGDCLSHIQHRCERREKRQGLSGIEWVLVNIAPFFRHTKRSAKKHIGRIAWKALASFLSDEANYTRHVDTLRKQFNQASKGALEKDTLLSHMYDNLKRTRQRKPLRKYRDVLLKRAYERFQASTENSRNNDKPLPGQCLTRPAS